MTVRKGFLRLSRSQVRVLPGAPIAWSEPHSGQATRTRILRWSTNGPHWEHALAVYRRWLLAMLVVAGYLMLTVLTHYGYEVHDLTFVLPHVGVLCVLGVLVARTLMAWDRVAAAQRPARSVRILYPIEG